MRLTHKNLLLTVRLFKPRPGRTRKTTRELRWNAASFLLLVFLVHGSALAQDFASAVDEVSPSILDWQTLTTEPKVVVVGNSKNVAITLRAQITDQANPAAISKYLKVEPAEVKLAEAGTAEFKVTAQGQPPQLASYTAFLTITGQNSSTIIRKMITVDFAGAKRVPEPAVSRLAVRVWRIFPAFVSSLLWDDSFVLNLKKKVIAAPAETNRRFILSRSQGGTAVIRWTAQSSSNGANDEPFVVLRLEGVDHAGQYDGTIDFKVRPAASSAPGVSSVLSSTLPSADTTMITIYATDIVVWPVIVILIGIAMVQGTKFYIDVKRQIWAWRREEAELGVSYRLAKQKFAGIADDNNLYTVYSIEKDFAERRRDILQRIQRVERDSTLKLAESSQAGESISEKLRWLSERVAAWAQFPVSIIRLRDELGRAYPIDVAPADLIQEESGLAEPPKVIAKSSESVVGGPLKVDEFEKKGAELVKLSSLVAIWGDLYRRFAAGTRGVRDIEGNNAGAPSGMKLTAEELEQLNSAKQTLKTVVNQLWSLTPDDDEKPIQTIRERLISVETILKGLIDSQVDGAVEASVSVPINADLSLEPVAVHDPASLIRGAKLLDSDRSQWRELRRGNDRERFSYYQAQLKKWDILTLVVAAVVTILTGLQLNYFGAAFGTLKDYATVFVWAVGTQTVMGLLPMVLEKILPRLRSSNILR